MFIISLSNINPDIQIEYQPEYMETPPQVSYTGRNGPVYIYGGKFVENIVQALARHVVMYQMLQIDTACAAAGLEGQIALTVHDEIVSIVHDDHVDTAAMITRDCMGTPPPWASQLPVSYELAVTDHYTK